MIKKSTIEGIRRYADLHCPTGSFVNAVLCNDLKEACSMADEENLAALPEIVRYCWNEIPHSCWGSPERVERWLAHSRLVPQEKGIRLAGIQPS
jgi:hypothetical protein